MSWISATSGSIVSYPSSPNQGAAAKPAVPPANDSPASLKTSQELLQTAVANDQRTSTGRFRIEEIQKFGKNSLAYSALQEGLKYFMRQDLGFIAYRHLSDGPGSVVVLADPICPRESQKPLLEAFLQEQHHPVFLHVSYPVAQILNELGFCINELGIETFIDIQKFSLSGSNRQQLAAALDKGTAEGLEICEVCDPDESTIAALKALSDEWVKQQVVAEHNEHFIVRPIVFVDEVDVRKFVATKNGQIVGMVVFEPLYDSGKVCGYIVNHPLSILNTAPVVDCIIVKAIEVFKAEGKRQLSLGLSPKAEVDDNKQFQYSKLLEAHFKYAFEKDKMLRDFKDILKHKSLYKPEVPDAREEQVYCAMKTRAFLVKLADSGLNPLKQTLSKIKKTFEMQAPKAPRPHV